MTPTALLGAGDLVLYDVRAVGHLSDRRRLLTCIHNSNRGAATRMCCARQNVYWPGIKADFVSTVRTCEPCKVLQSGQQQEPPMNDEHPTRSLDPKVTCGSDTASATIHHFRHLSREWMEDHVREREFCHSHITHCQKSQERLAFVSKDGPNRQQCL